MNQSRILALDLGKRRIGLALSDELGISAQGLETLERTNIREDLARLSQLVVERGVSLILIGNPLHMSGREGRQAEHAREFGKRLAETVSAASDYHLLTDGTNLYLETSARQIVDILKNARQPMLAICLSDAVRQVRADIRNGRKCNAAESGAARALRRAS